MIRSMTGFGDASCESDGTHYAIELRSVNNRYFKVNIRLPEELNGLDAEVESFLRKRISRGSIMVNISMRADQSAAGYEINQAMLNKYLKSIELYQNDLTIPATVDMAGLLNLPGVIQPPVNSDMLENSRPVVLDLLGKACDKLNVMRKTEGHGLEQDLLNHQEFIAENLKKIIELAPNVIETYHQRLRNRVEELLARAELIVPEIDLIREVAIYAERCDISEETQRMGAHLEQFQQFIDADGNKPAGRTLDFLSQELLREANTIASKSNDSDISGIIVEVKGTIDRIKEQVQNVE